ncbi:hypothetical protein IJ118_03715 [Candidatus Saccharibacteria bacterium]|nr:hypothetical protein [Candidatus Saccharibacteria bacterium]
MTWGGRLIQSVGVGVAYKVFGEYGAQVVMPIIFLLAFGLACSWLIYQLVKFRSHQKLMAIVIGFLTAGAIMYTTACLFDIYLWLDSAIVHFLGMIMVVFDMSVFVWMVKNYDCIKNKKWKVAVLLLIVFIGQTASEASMVLTIGWSFVALIAALCFKKLRKYRVVTCLMFGTLLVGGLVMVLAPGLWARANTSEATYSMVDYLILAPGKTFVKMLAETELWKISLVACIALFISFMQWRNNMRRAIWYYILVACLVTLSFSYVPMVLYFYGSHTLSIESRALALPSMGFFIGELILLIGIFSAILNKYENTKKEKVFCVVFAGVTAVIMIIAGIGIYRFDKGYIAALVVRASAVEYRDAQIAAYKNGLSDELVVADLPVMIEKSNATDFSSNGFTTPEWFYNGFLAYFDIQNDNLEVLGEKLIYENHVDWYKEVGVQICTIENKMVDARYYCANAAFQNELLKKEKR